MGRIEYKYLLSDRLLEKLHKLFIPYMIHDKYSAQRPDQEYTVRSIYFDTSRFSFYHEKISGIEKRKKIRIRGYNNYFKDALVFLEIKRKMGPSISKNRASIYYKNLSDLLETGEIMTNIFPHPGLKTSYENTKKHLFYIYNLNLKPVIKVIYEREAFFFKFDQKWRITIDKNLRSSLTVNPECLFDENVTVPNLKRYSILEIKGMGDIPSIIRRIVAKLELRLQALSKYTICLDSHSCYEKYLYR